MNDIKIITMRIQQNVLLFVLVICPLIFCHFYEPPTGELLADCLSVLKSDFNLLNIEAQLVCQWGNYRLGDVVEQNQNTRICESYPNSIACVYSDTLQSNQKGYVSDPQIFPDYKLRLLNDIVHKRASKGDTSLVGNKTAIIYLRIGDTMTGDTCHEIECKGEYHTYVWPIHRYTSILSHISERYPDIYIEIYAFPFHSTSSGWRRRDRIFRSIDYANKFKAFCTRYFRAERVHLRSMHTPDDDFTHAALSKVFVLPPHSGYAELIGKLVQLNGGETLNVHDFWDRNLYPDPEVASSKLASRAPWNSKTYSYALILFCICLSLLVYFIRTRNIVSRVKHKICNEFSDQ